MAETGTRPRPPFVEALEIVCNSLVRIVGALTDWKTAVPVLTLLVGGHIAEVALVGDKAILLKDIGAAAAAILESQSVTLLGWGLLAAVTPTAGAVIWLQHRRLQQQGTELAELRAELDPQRASSRDPQKLIERVRKSEEDILKELEDKTP